MVIKEHYEDQEEYQNRLRKLGEIRNFGVNPYPHSFKPGNGTVELQQSYGEKEIGFSEDAESGKTPNVSVSGRLVLFRAMGKNAFAQIQDQSGRIQVMFNRDNTTVTGFNTDSMKPIKFIEKMLDLGDLIGITGNLFHTHKGELTIYAKEVTLLCKTLLPLPEKHAGLTDKELRYRKRWLDLIANEGVRKTFIARSKILELIRTYCNDQGFLEVETPILQSIYGGAEAKPFTTKLLALDQKMYMRISLEIPLKKLLVGGMDKVFEIGKVFRNEGIDRNHNPEFTLLEAYAAWWDYNDMMRFFEELCESLALSLYGKTTLPVTSPHTKETIEIDLKAPWTKMTMVEAIQTYGNLDPNNLNDDELKKILKESGHVEAKKIDQLSRGLLIAALFEVVAEPKLIQPHHIYDHPKETTPLCKPHRNPEECKKGIVERFESFILGSEMCNAYSELNDPVLQRQLLEDQALRKEKGDEEASPYDSEFVEAICQGMPPAGGIGIGIDRLLMLLTNNHSIRDIIYFPWMKPSED